MDYKELSNAVKLCGSTPKVDQCKACPYWAGGNMSKCIPKMADDASTSINNLLARAEEAEVRAKKVENELDEALKLVGWIYFEACVSVEHDMRQYLDWLKAKIEEYREKNGELAWQDTEKSR